MKRNTLYIVFLLIVLILVCIYASFGISESFTTLTSIYANNIPCDVLRVGISAETLEKWFIGKQTKIETKNKNGTVTTETSEEEPLMVVFLSVLENMKERCQFKKIMDHLDNVTKSKKHIKKLADIVQDVNNILNKIVKNPENSEQKPGMIDMLVNKYKNKFTQEGFTPYLSVDDILDESNESKSCSQLETIAITKYLTRDSLKYTHRTINGLERLLCECHDQNKMIQKDIENILIKKNTNKDESINYNGIRKDLQKIKSCITRIKELFKLFSDYVNAKVVELGVVDTLDN